MREILFRGKLLGYNKWIYGGFYKHLSVTPSPVGPHEEIYDYLIFESGFSDWNLPKPLLTHKVKPETVGQYIGLDDSNGRKIFEGDIVFCWLERDQSDKCGLLYVVTFDYVCMHHLSNYDFKTIVGNIHDNPDMVSDENFDKLKDGSYIKFKNDSYIKGLPVQGTAKRGCVYDGNGGGKAN